MNSELILYVKSAFAQSEAIAGSKRVSIALRMKMENGSFVTTNAPFGYFVDKDGSLKVIPEQAEIVKRMNANAPLLNKENSSPQRREGEMTVAIDKGIFF